MGEDRDLPRLEPFGAEFLGCTRGEGATEIDRLLPCNWEADRAATEIAQAAA